MSKKARQFIKQLNAAINADMKQGNLMTLKDTDKKITSGLSTGSVNLNMALSGNPLIGYTRGRIVEIYGPEQCLDAKSNVKVVIVDKFGKDQTRKYFTIERLYERFHKKILKRGWGKYFRSSTQASNYFVLGVDEKTGIVMRNEIKDVVSCGKKLCYRIVTTGGHTLNATEDHKFYTQTGYKRLGDLRIGDAIYLHLNKRVKSFAIKRVSYKEICIRYAHPRGRKRIINGKTYYFVLRSILTYEADLNGFKNLKSYIACLNKLDAGGRVDFLCKSFMLHHRDGDKRNDSLSNLELMTDIEHRKYHAELNIKNLSYVVVTRMVSKIVCVGVKDTYDIKCVGPNHNYIANRFVVHNSGKTTLVLHAIAEAQALGWPAVFIDAEHALDPQYAEAIGVDFEALGFNQPECGEEALDLAEAVIKGGCPLVVVDSVAALTPRAELNGEMGATHMGLQARLMSQAMRKLTGLVKKSEAILLFINQIRMKIGVSFGNPETTTGGNALKFYASYRLEVRSPRGGAKTEKSLTAETVETGIASNVKVVKNKVFPPFRRASIPLRYGVGIDKNSDLVEYLDKVGKFVIPKGAKLKTVKLKVKGKYLSKNMVIRAMEDDPELYAEVFKYVDNG